MRVLTFAGTLSTIRPGTFAGAFLALLNGSTDRSTIAGNSQMIRIDQAFVYRIRKELLLIKPEDQVKRIIFSLFHMREKKS